MYLSHYNLLKKPFQLTTDPDFLWLGEKHKEAYATLKYAITENKGVLVLTGDVGTGKTTLINALIKSLEEDIVAATIYDPSLEVLEFFNVVATALKMGKTFESKGKFIAHFRQLLQKAHERKQKVLLIIDEAQSLSKELLENIRLLSNIELPNEKLINIFFVGQDELNRTLASQECRALRQRIVLTYNIKPLSAIEIFAYIKYRLKIAGTDIKLFNRKAIKEVYRFSSGYPRLINTICDHALLTGYVRKLNKITPAIIIECSYELNLSGEIKKSTFSNFLEQPYT
ncbi:MAG: ATPase, T2SS/T4P/T4SS family, partial [Desulfobacterales bacterium]